MSHALIVGETARVTHVEATGVLQTLFRVTLKNVRRVYGSATVARTMTVEITGTEEGVLRPHRELALLLEFDKAHPPRVLSWQYTWTVACAPRQLLAGTELGKEVFLFHASDQSDCTPIDFLPPEGR